MSSLSNPNSGFSVNDRGIDYAVTFRLAANVCNLETLRREATAHQLAHGGSPARHPCLETPGFNGFEFVIVQHDLKPHEALSTHFESPQINKKRQLASTSAQKLIVFTPLHCEPS
jgi:hypothetical protein